MSDETEPLEPLNWEVGDIDGSMTIKQIVELNIDSAIRQIFQQGAPGEFDSVSGSEIELHPNGIRCWLFEGAYNFVVPWRSMYCVGDVYPVDVQDRLEELDAIMAGFAASPFIALRKSSDNWFERAATRNQFTTMHIAAFIAIIHAFGNFEALAVHGYMRSARLFPGMTMEPYAVFQFTFKRSCSI